MTKECVHRFSCPRPQHTDVHDEHVLASDYEALEAELRELQVFRQAVLDPENQPSQFGTTLAKVQPPSKDVSSPIRYELVKRRDGDPDMRTHQRGPWVLHTDHTRIVERLQAERDELYRANVDLSTRLSHEPPAGYQCMVAGCPANHASKREVCGSPANIAGNLQLLQTRAALTDAIALLRRWRKRESDCIPVGTGEDQRLFSETGMHAGHWERTFGIGDHAGEQPAPPPRADHTKWDGPTHTCIDNRFHIGAKDRCSRCDQRSAAERLADGDATVVAAQTKRADDLDGRTGNAKDNTGCDI